MFFSPRIHLKQLAQLSRRMAVATRAGLDDRRIWRDEAQRGGWAYRAAVAKVSDAVSHGSSVGEGLAAAGEYFPPMFRRVVEVGDTTGRLEQTYKQLADHYEHVVAARRTFVGALTWPIIQLCLAIGVVGVVIWISSALGLKDADDKPLDMFGLGLVGAKGLVIYFSFLVISAIKIFVSFQAARHGMRWTKALQRASLKIPVVGGALETLALARFTWALQLLLDTAMDLRKALPLALDATGNDYYSRLAPQIVDGVERGDTLHVTLESTNAFPRELLDAIDVGERAGMLPETMERQSHEYRERAKVAISILAQVLGWLVWAAVAGLIILLIFRVFSSYVATIERFSRPM